MRSAAPPVHPPDAHVQSGAGLSTTSSARHTRACCHGTVTPETLVSTVRDGWRHLAGPQAEFSAAVNVAVAPASKLCPPGWCGIITIADGTLATAPDQAQASALQHTLGSLPTAQHTDAASVASAVASGLSVLDVLGPASLAYLPDDAVEPSLAGGTGQVDTVSLTDSLVRALLTACPADETEEAGIDSITSPAFILVRGNQALAVAGYEHWPSNIAQMSVLTHPAARGAGSARLAAAVASNHARRAGLLPQWRARPAASLRVAEALGYTLLGRQLSVRLSAPVDASRRGHGRDRCS